MTDTNTTISVCVFCGSRDGNQPDYVAAAQMMGAQLAASGITLVYGGGGSGLMGAIADAILSHGGRAVGVIPEKLVERELAHTGLDDLHVVPDMHARKAMMARLSDGFIAMPGGIGTMEELFEALTWLQLGYQDKPVALLNVAHYYDSLIGFLDTSVEQGFLDAKTRQSLIATNQVESLVKQLAERIKIVPRCS